MVNCDNEMENYHQSSPSPKQSPLMYGFFDNVDEREMSGEFFFIKLEHNSNGEKRNTITFAIEIQAMIHKLC